MKHFWIWLVLLCVGLSFPMKAEAPDDQYVRIYRLIQEGDQLSGSNQLERAREKYVAAQAELQKLQVSSPSWNEKLVQFRLRYVSEKLGILPVAPAALTLPERPVQAAPIPGATPAANDLDNLLRNFTNQVRRLSDDNVVLQLKLKEALAARPASIDPTELRRAEDRIRVLEKEKELFRVSLEREQSKQTQVNPTQVEDLKKALASANAQLAQQTEIATTLAREKEILDARIQVLQRQAQEVAIARPEPAPAPPRADPPSLPAPPRPEPPAVGPSAAENELAVAKVSMQKQETEVTRLQIALNGIQLEKTRLEAAKKDLETKLADAASSNRASQPAASESARVKQVQKERDDLQKKLNDTSVQLIELKSRTEKLQKEQSGQQLAEMRAKMAALEAKSVPYTPEELALFKQPQQMSATRTETAATPSPTASREMPRGAGPLLIEGDRAFRAGRFDEAEKKYAEVLKLDEKNVITLGLVASSQSAQAHYDDAATSLRRALDLDPNHSFSHRNLGIVRFKQSKFDEAFDSLSRAVQLDPKDPEAQNYLGVTLSEKGQRVAAEAALRKAIQLAPGYAEAHYNLAVTYALQKPPFTELARWHYQKGLSLGNKPNLDLEKLIEAPAPASGK